MKDSLELILTYRNTTNDIFNLYPEAIIGLTPKHKAFITYDKPERIGYILNFFTNYDSIVCLKPGEEFKYTFNIVADDNFFYEGENDVLVYYHFFDKPTDTRKRKRFKREPILSLWSPPIRLKVNPNE